MVAVKVRISELNASANWIWLRSRAPEPSGRECSWRLGRAGRGLHWRRESTYRTEVSGGEVVRPVAELTPDQQVVEHEVDYVRRGTDGNGLQPTCHLP